MIKKQILFILVIVFCFASIVFSQVRRDALHVAASNGNVEKVVELLRGKPHIDIRDSSGGTVLHAAVSQDNLVVIDTVIKAGYDINAKKPMNGNTPLHDAVVRNSLPVVKLLIERGADYTIKNLDKLTAVDIANRESKHEISEYFKSIGINNN